jgi:hypothetical protein
MVSGVRQGNLATFFVLTFAVTWTCFISVAIWIPASTTPGMLLVLLGAYAPSMVALGLTARNDGRAAVQDLLGRVLLWRVPPSSYCSPWATFLRSS